MKRRNTPSKQAILDILHESDIALSQDMIMDKVQFNIDRVTVYRILNTFCEDGIAHKITSDDGKSYFALCNACTEHHHHDHFHFQCVKCNQLECLSQEIDIKLPVGYQVKDMNCVVVGVCAKCNAN